MSSRNHAHPRASWLREVREHGTPCARTPTPQVHMHTPSRRVTPGPSVITQTHQQIRTGTVAFVSTGLLSASRKINALLSKMSHRPHKSRPLGSCALPPPTLPHYSSKGEMQRVIIIRQGQITGLGGGWLRSIKGCFLGNRGRYWEAGAGGPKWVGVGSCRRVT